MKTSLKILLISLVVSLSACTTNEYEQTAFSDSIAATVTLTTAARPDREYLGITASNETFTFGDIATDLLVIEVFSMYCPLCQRSAEHINELYITLRDRGLATSVKMIGVGNTNTDFEVSLFRKKFTVPFPLFADPDSVIADAVDSRGLPFIIIARKNADGNFGVLYRKNGEVKHAASLFNEIKQYLPQN